MSKLTRQVSKVTDFNVNIFDNGFTINFTGYDDDDNWADVKMIVPNVDELVEIVKEIVNLPRK
ncbi:hypothetical protein UFOVP118_52 [uncultured Caudovirales phage]|uniref:Uncharacterized protein n=1 Tax=uncultured Caudovirales phage TaxID=2100421 RepID=A0A6J5LCI7_9CAUD|nr:hypothetical protein UFOVP118_52 [uncultured Caudovirales phage]